MEREAREEEERKERERAVEAEKAKAKAARAGHVAKRNPVFVGNAIIYTLVGAALGYGAYRKHLEGRLSWKLVGAWSGVVGAFGAVDYFVSKYVSNCSSCRSGFMEGALANISNSRWLLQNKYPPK